MRTPLKSYSDEELSLRVFNDEGLYRIRHTHDLFDVLRELFTFTVEQRDELIDDLAADLEEAAK